MSSLRDFRSAITLAVTILSIAQLPLARAQANQPQVGTLEVTSRLVTLDVSVVDAKGSPVTDLTRSDVTVLENGQPQSIRNFEPFNDHRLAPTLTATSINGAPDLERLAPNSPVTVLVLDEFNTEFRDTAYARAQIRRYLLAQPPVLRQPTTFLAATDKGFQQIQDYTLDRQRLLDALAHLPATLPGLLMRTGHTSEGLILRFGRTVDSLQQIAKATTGHAGRKNIIWVGRGFDSINLSKTTPGNAAALQGVSERAVNLLREAHATVYTVDPTLSTALVGELDASDDNAFVAEAHNPTSPFNDNVSFNTMAPLTGGRAFALYNDIDREIATSVSEGSSYYAIAYVPTAAVDPANPYRRIDVRVDRPGLKVITRHGYYSVTPQLAAATPQRALKTEGYDISSAISSGITYTGLHITAALAPANPEQCIVQVATQDIQWQPQPDGTSSAHLTLVIVAMDPKGKALAHDASDVTARLTSAKEMTRNPFTTLKINVPAAKNPKTLRLAVRDAVSGKLGTIQIALPH